MGTECNKVKNEDEIKSSSGIGNCRSQSPSAAEDLRQSQPRSAENNNNKMVAPPPPTTTTATEGEPPAKRMKVEDSCAQSDSQRMVRKKGSTTAMIGAHKSARPSATTSAAVETASKTQASINPVVQRSQNATSASSSVSPGSLSVVTAGNSSHDSLTEPATCVTNQSIAIKKKNKTVSLSCSSSTVAAVVTSNGLPTTAVAAAAATTTTTKIGSKAVATKVNTTAVSPRKHQTQPLTDSSSSTEITTTIKITPIDNNNVSSDAAPLKAINYGHLRIKYLGELEYMLREFRKLERQLLGAKGATQHEESTGSRERREKLHSFILHLEDTILQIEAGCKHEDDNKTTAASTIDDKNINGRKQTPTTNGVDDRYSSKACSGVDGENRNKNKESSDIAEVKKKQSLASSILTKGKEEEETVQKIEEHILANLLPVKVRLKKQLAAQQGATKNPAGMPSLRRGSLQPPSTRGKGTFAEAAENRRKEAEAARLAAQEKHERAVRNVSDPTQFGKPLSGGGSSLTQKLHGATLGSKQRRKGSGVGSSSISRNNVLNGNTTHKKIQLGKSGERKILYGGMVPGSTQQKSGLSAASGVHPEIIISSNQHAKVSASNDCELSLTSASTRGPMIVLKTTNFESNAAAPAARTSLVDAEATATTGSSKTINAKVNNIMKEVETTTLDSTTQKKSASKSTSTGLSEEEKIKFKQHRRKRKLLRLARRNERERLKQQNPKPQPTTIVSTNETPASNNSTSSQARKKVFHNYNKGPQKKGPRVVEYTCSFCSELYSSTCDLNPWWALAQHKCPKCQKTQIPRIDINSTANIIEYHPALLSHLEDGGRGLNSGSVQANTAQAVASGAMHSSGKSSLDCESDSDLSELSDDDVSIGSLKVSSLEADIQSMTPSERAEHETFGDEYEGPRLSDEHAAKLLILMGHASTCPCHHKCAKHRDICRSTKYMMLHVRDCPGTTSTFDVCPFPWCRKVKHLLYHLVSCSNPDQCQICSPKDLPKGLESLVGLNTHRMKGFRQRMVATAKATLKANHEKHTCKVVTKPLSTNRTASATQLNNLRKVISAAKISATESVALQGVAPFDANRESVPARVAPNPFTITANATSDHETEMSQEEIDINDEIAKLDEQLNPRPIEEGLVAIDVAQSTNSTVKIEFSSATNQLNQGPIIEEHKVKIQDLNGSIDTTNYPTSIEKSKQYENPDKNCEISPEDEQFLPTPISAIKMGGNDVDAPEMSDLLAPTETEQIRFTKNSNFSDLMTKSNFNADIGSGACNISDTSDTTTNNSNMLVLNSDATIAQSTCMALNEDHSGVLAVSIESTPDIATVNDAAVVAAATAADVNAENNSTAGGVKVN